MKKHLLALAAMTLTTFGAFADVATGDIYSMDVTSDSFGRIPDVNNPLIAGERLTFRLRLLNRGHGSADTTRPWDFYPNTALSISAESSFFKPQFGFLFGSKPVFADYIGRQDVSVDGVDKFTDLFFQYTVKQGDLARPAHFMGIDGKVPTESSAAYAIRYMNYRGNYWKLTNGDGDTCNLSYAVDPILPDPDTSGIYPRNNGTVDGSGLEIYVQTVQFDPDNDYKTATSASSGDDVWRLFYTGDATHSALPTMATIVLKGGVADEATPVYVWVEDPTVADVLSGVDTHPITDKNPKTGETFTRSVRTVTIPMGSNFAPFHLVGIDSTDGHNTTKVRLSSSPNLTFTLAGDLVEDWIERTIQVAEMPDPYVTIQIQGPDGQPLEKNTAQLTAEYDKPIARIVLSLMKAPSAEMTVTLRQDLADADIFDDGLLGISEEETGTPWENETLEVTFRPEDALTKTLYVYGKGTTKKFSTNGCKFTVDTSGAPEYDGESGKHSANLILKDMLPLLVKPTAGDSITDAMAGKNYSLDIAISDARKHMEDAANGDAAYTVYYKVEAPGTEGKWDSDGAVVLNDADSGVATISVPFDIEGDCNLLLYVLSPSGKKSATTTIPVKVSAPKRATATLDRENGVYAEGETAYVTFHLTQKYKSELYAFLVPQDDDTKTKFETDISSEISGAIGVYFGPNETDVKIPTEIRVLDGKTVGRYQVFMCTTKNYSKTKSGGYIGDVFAISATNVIPKITKVSMGAGADVKVSGGEIKKAVAMNVEKTFTVSVDEPGLKDLDATGDDEFITRWQFGTEIKEMRGNPFTQSVKYAFSNPGVQTVIVQCQDKDMRATDKWSEEFEFKVNVLEMPKITITPVLGSKSFYEDQSGSEQSTFEVALSTPPDIASGGDKLKVALSVEKLGDSTAEYDASDCVLSRPYVEFSSGDANARTFYLSKLDGSAGSAAYGFRITAKVVNAEVDTEGKKWDDGEVDIVVLNRDPVINQPAERLNEKGEPIVSNAQLGKDYEIKWAINDVMGDRKGMTVTWETNEGDSKIYQQGAGYDDVMSGVHPFKFNSSGDKTLTLTVTDKDGGYASRTFHYTVEASKSIVVAAHGPAAATASNNGLSASYGAAPGLGAGRVDAVDRNPTKVTKWMSSYTVGVSDSELLMTATGYSVNDINDKVDINGTYPKEGANYAYNNQKGLGEAGFDSFLYAWVYNNIAKESAAGDKDIIFMMAKEGNAALPLPTESAGGDKGGSTSFATQYWEALFSREFYASDNCGDINLDGVPDVFALRYAPDVFTWRTQTLVGDDLKNIAAANNDADFLPNTMSAAYAHFIPGLSNSWVTAGRAFKMIDEIRGYDPHFNDATAATFPDGAANPMAIQDVVPDRVYTDPEADANSTLSLLEYVAYTNWCERTGHDAATSAALWSPERPTRPDMADTDEDGMPDGYEYYFWYKAHVGWLEETKKKEGDAEITVTNLVRLTGRRYNQFSPCEPFTITADEIEKLYDPIVANNFAADTDTDNDGLPDLIEFEIGTNPFDYDTDNDGLPDGWEVCMSYDDKVLDPLKAATTLAGYDGNWNPDGDQMALVTIPAYRAKVTYTNDLSKTNYIFVLKGEQYPDDFVRLTRALCIDCPDDDIGLGMFTSEKKNRLTLAEGMLYKTGDPGTYALTKIIANEMDSDNGRYKKAVAAIRLVEEISVEDEDLYNINVIHWNVLEIKGFHPWTAWKKPTPANTHRINTGVYTTYDEFMLMAWSYQMGTVMAAEITPNGSTTFMEIWPKCTTQPFNADSDEDGMPDGWELYIMGRGNPINHPYSPLFPFGNVVGQEWRDPDKDGLDFLEEFNGVECCNEYADCETIKNGFPEWRNKAWPTDPNFFDTDGDGLPDGAEHTWLYGDSGVDGGGLNPHSMDTDGDGLPDPWELEFCGTYTQSSSSTEVVESTTGEGTNAVTTVSTNVTTKAGGFEGHGMNPTASDAYEDYDYDGLQNWQEYMIGAMRCWRYDDTTSPWHTHKMDLGKLSRALMDDEYFAELVLDPWTTEVSEFDVQERVRNVEFNPGFATGYFNVGIYFTCATKDYDPNRGRWYMLKDGIYHDLADADNLYGNYFKRGFKGIKICEAGTEYEKHLNRWTAPYFAAEMEPDQFKVLSGGTKGNSLCPQKYICCDPKSADSDGDGMDDYYEIFHGLNPLLGEAGSEGRDGGPRDLIYIAYGGSNAGAPHAMANYWMERVMGTWIQHHSPKIRSVALIDQDMATAGLVKDASMTGLCFTEFPWLTGLVYADVDGDNIRNEQEAILPNPQAAPTYQHTDPTPLWLTDSSSPDSITYRFYNIVTPGWAITPELPMSTKGKFEYEGKIYDLTEFPWVAYNARLGQIEEINYNINIADRSDWLYDFEENEGYDSDHDYLSDFEESEARTKSASDPQVFDDPIRHQAMYFNGKDAFLQTPLEESIVLPDILADTEPRQDFLYFTAEAWVKPDVEMLGDGRHTVLERTLYTGMAGPADERYLRRNFYVGIDNGKWYVYFDSTGTDDKKYVAIENGPLVNTNWTHVAVSYGPGNNDEYDVEEPMMLKLFINGQCIAQKKTALQPEHGTKSIIITDIGGDNTSRAWNATPTFLVGGSVKTVTGLCFDTAWRMRVESNNPDTVIPEVIFDGPTFDDYENFFKGYIDEVRIWDGARKPTEIFADVDNKVRYGFAEVEQNRKNFFDAWSQGARRHAPGQTGLPLPAEIRGHWSFDHLPGAVDVKDVMPVPAGFSTSRSVTDAMASWARPVGWTNAWWHSVTVRSTVYTDTAWIPWINNTVAHVKNMDGTTFDTMFWTEALCGVAPASEFGFTKFAFPRNAEVYSRIHQNTYLEGDLLLSPSTRWELMKTNAEDKVKYRYTRRNMNVIGSDLLPMGGAYPKRISTAEGGMWDDGFAADAWAETGADADDNGLPDWWEKYARRNLANGVEPWEALDRNMTVTYNGAKMPLWQAYLYDIAMGMLPDGKRHPEYADKRDSDKDYMPDWWEDIYGIQGNRADDATRDSDFDGLSNYAEYRVSLAENSTQLNPILWATYASNAQDYPDYFLKSTIDPKYYLGFKYTDHDFIENWLEGQTNGMDSAIYDPHLDPLGTGWDNWSRARAQFNERTFIDVPVMNFADVANADTIVEESVTNEVEETSIRVFAGIRPQIQLTAYGSVGTTYSYYEEATSNETGLVTNTYAAANMMTLKAYQQGALVARFMVEGETAGKRLVATIDGVGLKQGETIFVLENGYAVGFQKVNVGFDLVKLVIDVKESSNVIPSDAYSFAMGGITYIRRTEINGQKCKPRVVWAGVPADEYGTITEADILNHPNCAFDLDWKYLLADAKAMGIKQSDIQVVTYEAGDSEYGSFFGNGFQKIFVGLDGTTAGFERPQATLVGAMPDGGKVRTARPQFTFTGLELATAFAIEVSTTPSTNGVIYSAINLLPAKTPQGYIFTAPLDIGEELQDGSNYYWRVLGMNAKWSNLPVDEFTVTGDTTGTYKTNWIVKADAEWSKWDRFTTAVDSTEGTTGYGALKAKVRYFGDASATNIVLGVYESADFAGEPVANRTGVAFETEVKFDGLAAGEYYVMAFNDKNGNGKRDAWESWGYGNKVGSEFEKDALKPDYYTPVTVAVSAQKTALKTATIYMEDTDWGHFNEQGDFVMGADGTPDGLQGEPTVVDPEDIDLDWDGLTRSEEAAWGTDPLMSDTDGDGFPDGYEVWVGMDPLNDDYVTVTKSLTDGTTYEIQNPVAYSTNGDNDVMAYAIVQKHVYVVSNVVSGTTWTVTPPKNDPFNGQYLLGMTLPTSVTYPTVGLYRETDEYEENWEGAEDGVIYALGGEVSVNANFVVVADLGMMDVQLMHMQVMKEFGFISGLATAGDVEKGLRTVTAADGTVGKVGTRPFYGIDKYLVALFFGDPTETFKDAEGQTVKAMEWSFTSPVQFNQMAYKRLWGKDKTVLSPFTNDFDGDAIPDGWELYVAMDPSGSLILSPWKFMQDFKLKDSTTMTLTDGTHPQRLEYNGWIYFTADGRPVRVNDPDWTLADMYNNGINPANPYDTNSLLPGTGIADKDARKYNIETPENQLADVDNDGLSNWAEYEGFKQFGDAFDVNDAMSLTNRLDYWAFIEGTNTYAGAALTDHDFVEDAWEDEFQVMAPDGFYYASRYAADARADRDGDGWSNYAEARVGSDPRYGRKQSLSSVASDGDFTTTEYPIPVVKTTITYNGDVFNCPLVIKAWRGSQAKGDPDAVWNVASLSDEARVNVRFLGRNPGRPMSINLGPGSVAEGSVKLEAFDPYYVTYTDTYETNGTLKASTFVRHGFDTSKWSDYAFFDQPFATDGYNFVDVGNIDYETGNITIPFDGEILNDPEYYWNVSGSAGTPGGTHIYENWDLANSYFRIQWRSRVVETGNTKTLYLSVSDDPSAENPCRGYLREGKNLFVVFADLNKDGSWSPDEPMGIVRDVDIGWSGTEINIELTDNKAPFERFILQGNANVNAAETNALVSGRIVITRTTIDGEQLDEPRKLIFTGDTAKRIWFGENDYIRRGEFDLDWRYLTADAERLGYTGSRSFHTVGYTLAYLNNPSNVVSEFTRTFDTTPIAPTITLGSEVKVLTARPVLTFKTTEGYTAFTLQIATDERFENLVYEKTDFLPPAASESLGRTFSPEISVGNGLEDGMTYYWRVAQLNAKFRTNVWSQPARFTTAVASNEANTGYGALKATIGYFGSAADPATNVIVGAWASPDFTGNPAASVRLTNDCTIASFADQPVTVELDGLVPGDYYLLAFVDANGNGVRDLDEKWGYVNRFGTDAVGVFTPVAVTTASTKGATAIGAIVIEDNDLDLTATSGGVYVSGDADGDGLTDDSEEDEFGTDPYLWDTDGDGMPDGWEVWAGTDPLAADADYVEANDLMAYLEKTFTGVTVWDGTNLDSRVDYLLPKSEKVPFVGGAVSNLCFYVPYEYVAGESWGLGTNVTGVAGIVYATEETTVVLVHDQVYAETGYKWPEYTKPFTALDKYLLLRYLDSQGRADEDLVNQTRAWAGYTLKPGYPDNDYDGVMDGWELYVGADPWDFADRESDPDKDGLTLVQEYDRGNSPTDPNNLDTDNDGILDRYAYMYHLKGGDSGKDFDGDGLSNYAEYLITEVFKYAKCDPDNAKTDGACVDYFQKVGSLYLGEIFTDHDQIEDTWEDGFERSIPGSVNEFFASRDRYDPTQDADNDGWSNYAEYRAGTDPSATAALSIDGYTCAEFPVPTVEVNVSYNGSDLISGPLVIKAWNQKDDYEMVKAPDAVWTLGTTGTTTTQDGGYQSSDNTQGSALQQHEKFLGRKPHGTRTFYLTGGNVSEGSVKLLFIDKGYGLVSYDPVLDGFRAVGAGEPDNALWFYGIIDRGGKLVRLGSSIYKALGYEEAEVGTIDYKTGKITINFDHEELSGNMAADPGEGQSGSSNDQNKQDTNTEAGLYHWLDLDESYMRIEWKSSQALVSVAGVHYFSDPDPVSDTAKSHGHLREGKNSFVCFVDDNGDGEYTPGELFGFVRDVDVGWSGAKFSVELTETSPIFGRVGFDGANDRLVWYGIDSGNVTNMSYGTATDATAGSMSLVDSSLSGGKLQHVRIDRYAVNGLVLGSSTNQIAVPNRVLVDKWFNLGSRPYIFEGDFLEKNIFDIDWEHFKSDIVESSLVKLRFGGAVDTVTYRVVIDNAEAVHPALSNRVLNVAFTRWFDSKQMTPTGLDAMLVYGARPTFRWSMKDENGDIHNGYTAFKLRILADDDKTVIYESPMTRIPFQDRDGNYVWEAPFFIGDQTPQGQLLARTGTFRWTVSVYNAKFKADAYAPSVPFATAVNQQQEVADHGFGSLKVAVKYTGPDEVLKDCANLATTGGMVRVQAFTSPDFAGIPSAQTVITNLVALTNAMDNSVNVTLYGLPAGDYYVRAYIDSNGNFEKDDFESWGAAKSVSTIAANTAAPIVGLYIEDADTDQDWIPDVWEWVTHSSLTNEYAKIDEGGILLKSATYSELTGENAGPNFSRFLTGASLTFFENAEAAAKLIPDLASDTTKKAIEVIRDAIEKKVMPDTLRISSLVVDAANGKVLLTVDADVTDSIAGKLLTPIYELKAPTEVTVSIFKKSSLLVNEWTWVDDVQVPITSRLDQTIEVPIKGVDFNSGFYKVEVIQ